MPKKVSIVVITYNAKDDLKECLQSLERQSYNEIEIVVVNDASTDGTFQFLQQYRKKTSTELVIISNKTNKGVAGSRNVGIQHAIGDIIAFTDADCVAETGWMSELIQGFDQKGVVAVGGKVIHKRIRNIWELSEKGHDFVSSSEGYVSYIVGCNMCFLSDVLKKVMFNDELKYGYEEALLCDDLSDAGYKIYYRPQAIVQHKHRSTLGSLLKRKYALGSSSIWYRKKRNKLFMLKRHIIFLVAFLLLPFSLIDQSFPSLVFILCLIVSASLLRDELIFDAKSIKEIIITFPFLFFIELFHFAGSIAGFIRYRMLSK